ncbi:MAG: CYTH domain-containing protein [Clostridia bacterium]
MNKDILLEDFENTIYERVVKNELAGEKEKPVVLIAGASACGKGYIADKLKSSLVEKGIRPYILCLDDFYKGISLTIVSKANKNFFNEQLDVEEITSIVKVVIEESSFVNKLCDKNYFELLNKFSVLYGNERAQKIVSALKTEFSRINFDEPDAVNLEKAAQIVNSFSKGEAFEYPLCTMDFARGEHKHTPSSIFKSSDYDMIVVEGLYSLTNDFLESLNKTNNLTKLFISTDFKTMLVRRLSRDILKGRSSMSGKGTLKFMLNVVLPAFNKYILPTKTNADFVVSNSLSKSETYLKPKGMFQEKIKLETREDTLRVLNSLIKNLDFKFEKTTKQEDWFFESPDSLVPDTSNLIRLRLQDDIVETCIFKGSPIYSCDGKSVRPTEIFLNKESFDRELGEKEELLQAFSNGGLKAYANVVKKRTVLKNDDLNCFVNFDVVEGLGNFIEINSNTIANINNLKKELEIEKMPSAKCYLDEVLALNKENYKIESEVKLLLSKFPSIDFQSKKHIEQTYLNLYSKEKIKQIKKFIPFGNFPDIKEARVRVENFGEKCFLTLKNNNNLSRREIEREISFKDALFLSNDEIVGKVFKERYIAQLNTDLTLEVDKYLDRNLVIAEVEFTPSLYNPETIIPLVEEKIEAQVKDVTNNPLYKNAYLAKSYLCTPKNVPSKTSNHTFESKSVTNENLKI